MILDSRATFALELIRQFSDAGHRVIAADSIRFPLGRFSSHTDRHERIPAPSLAPRKFVRAVNRLIETYAVDVVIGSGESTLHLAQHAEQLPSEPLRLIDNLASLRTAHNKWLFNQAARRSGLDAPRATLLRSLEEALHAFDTGRELVFKPVYGRFGAHTLIRPTDRSQVEELSITPTRPWIAQDFVEGRPLNTLSVAHNGRITAHATYEVIAALPSGAAYAGRSVEHDAAFEWCKRYVSEQNLTGHFGFDLIEQPGGTISAIECNPRATSGVHYFVPADRLADAYLHPDAAFRHAPAGRSIMSKALMRGALPSALRSPKERDRWFEVYGRSRDVVGVPDDPNPQRLLHLMNLELVRIARRERTSLAEAASFGISWDGNSGFSAPWPELPSFEAEASHVPAPTTRASDIGAEQAAARRISDETGCLDPSAAAPARSKPTRV